MNRLRIVIDTKVLISAALKPTSLEAQLFELIAYRAFELCLSEEILAEYRGVLNRPKFAHVGPERVARLLGLVAAEATMVVPMDRLAISKHEEDNRFYECAAASGADYIVTGNTRHFEKPYKDTSITTTRKFLELLRSDIGKE